MARSGQTAQEFIQGSFAPLVAVLSAPSVDVIVTKNNLSFVELLQPFLTLECEGQFREPNGTVCIVKNLRLIVRDVNWKPLQPTEARRQLNNAVLNNYNDKTVPLEFEGRKFTLPQSTLWFDSWRETYFEVQFPSDHEYTKHFLSCMCVATTSDENVVETFNNLNQQFTDLLSVTPPKLPKWFNSSVLKSYILLHDVSSTPKENADTIFESMKQSFEPNCCFMLSINSRTAGEQALSVDHWSPFIRRNETSQTELPVMASNIATTPSEPPPSTDSDVAISQEVAHPLTAIEIEYDNANSLQTHSFSGSSESVNVIGKTPDCEVHGAALNATDIESIKRFIQDYASRGLLPYIERQITVLSEAVANRKGVSRSLLSATKRWFGTGKGGNPTANNSVIYSSECGELQLRRLGDLWFMLGQWQRAFDTYHTAKREFLADGAWLCYAGALEMAALSAFMSGEANRKTHAYMEESIVTYLNTCRMVQYAVRATLLSALCLTSAGLHGEAAKQLIRMTSEDSDLRSAMLLEQAALCFLAGPGGTGPGVGVRAMCRKYAFHMVLAGHRFSKAGQKKHAYRCYKQAYQVYEHSGWRLSTDHVQFALGRLAGALRRPREAALWLAAPLAPASPQPRPQHRAFLRDYMLAHQQWVESAEVRELVALPLPLAQRARTALAAAGPAPLSAPGRAPASSVTLQDAHRSELEDKYWHKMEEMLLLAARGSAPMIFKPSVSLFTAQTDESPVVPQGEPVQISITLRNPLKVPLVLNDLEILWRFKSNDPDTAEWLNNEPAVATGAVMEANVIFGPKIKSVTLEGEQTEVLTFSLTPLQVGQLVVHGLAYKLINGGEENEVGQILTISGKVILEASPGEPSDKRLHITVGPCAPCLQMTFSETHKEVIAGELLKVDVEFRNAGPVALRGLRLAVSHPDCAQLQPAADSAGAGEEPFRDLREHYFTDAPPDLEERAARAAARRAAAARHVRYAARSLAAGASCRAALLLRPRRHSAAAPLRLLAYYEPDAPAAPAAPAATAAPASSHRLLRHVFRFDVHEAVEIVAMPRRSVETTGDAAAERMTLALEVQNISSDRCSGVEVLEASLLSAQWRLARLVAARDKAAALASHEKLHVVLEAARLPPAAARSTHIHHSGLKINTGDPLSHPDINHPPFSKFVMEYKTSFIEDEDLFFNEKKNCNGLIQSMLVVRWKARDKSGRSAIGQHCAWLECFAPAAAPAPAPALAPALAPAPTPIALLDANYLKPKKENVVLFKMEHANHVSHNFKEKKICVVPITINIVNCYGVPVNAYIDMSKKRESCGVGWAGALGGGGGGSGGGVAVALQRFSAQRVRVRALVAAPGSYLLGDAFALTSRATSAATADAGLVSHLCADATLLVVEQTS